MARKPSRNAKPSQKPGADPASLSEQAPSQSNGPRNPNYRNPSPKDRWRPGQSGNPKGRPKKAKNLRTLLEEALARPAARTEDGKIVTHRELIIRRLITEAAHGELKMLIPALEKMIAILGVEDEQDSRASLSSNDMQILAEFMSPPSTGDRDVQAEGGPAQNGPADNDDGAPSSANLSQSEAGGDDAAN